MNILCGTEFSEQARKAMRVAAAISRKTNDSLKLAHAMHPSLVELLGKTQLVRYRTVMQRRLKNERTHLGSEPWTIDETLIVGKPESSLIRAARKLRSELIVLGAASPNGPLASWRRTLAERVAERSSTPTLVVSDEVRLAEWLNGRATLDVFVCYNFSAGARNALKSVRTIAAAGPCRLVLGYVSCPIDETFRFGIGKSAGQKHTALEVESILRRNAELDCRKLSGLEPDEVRIVSSCEDAGKPLLEMAKAANAALVVVGSPKRSPLSRFINGSVSGSFLRNGSMNTLVGPGSVSRRGMVERTSYDRVLVPTDMTQDPEKAVLAGIEATNPGGELCLLHVVRPPQYRLMDEADNQKLKHFSRSLMRSAQRIEPTKKIARHVEVIAHEHPFVAICQAAERFGAELICMATDKNKKKRKRFGLSTTRSVVRRSRRPVLVVPK